MIRTRLTRNLVLAGFTIAAPAVVTAWPATAIAGMGAVLPHWHAKPCSGDECRADDPRSNETCTGLLCSFSSAKAMQPPVTAAQAAEAERARAAAAAAAPPPVAETPAPAKPRKHLAKRSPKAASIARTAAPTETAAATAPVR